MCHRQVSQCNKKVTSNSQIHKEQLSFQYFGKFLNKFEPSKAGFECQSHVRSSFNDKMSRKFLFGSKT